MMCPIKIHLHKVLLFLLVTVSLLSGTIALYCQTEAAQKPLQLSENLALLAGDVVMFRTNVGTNRVGFLTPRVSGNTLSNECSIVPMTSSIEQSAMAQFLVVPVAVVDPDAYEQDTSIDSGGGSIGPTSMSKPRLVSTIQLVHVESGRLMGTRTCANPIQDNTQATCTPFAPVLLPKSLSYPCDSVLGDFHTIWDVDAHDIPTSSYESLLKNKTGIVQQRNSTLIRVDDIPVVFPGTANTINTNNGFSIFSNQQRAETDDGQVRDGVRGGVRGDAEEDMLMSTFGLHGNISTDTATDTATDFTQGLRTCVSPRSSVFSLEEHRERQRTARRVARLLAMDETALAAHAETEEGREDVLLWLRGEGKEGGEGEDVCVAEATRNGAGGAGGGVGVGVGGVREDVSTVLSRGVAAHHAVFAEMADMYYRDARHLPLTLGNVHGHTEIPDTDSGVSHLSPLSPTAAATLSARKTVRTLSAGEARALAAALLEAERWESLEKAVSAPASEESNLWSRLQGNTPAHRRAALLRRIQQRLQLADADATRAEGTRPRGTSGGSGSGGAGGSVNGSGSGGGGVVVQRTRAVSTMSDKSDDNADDDTHDHDSNNTASDTQADATQRSAAASTGGAAEGGLNISGAALASATGVPGVWSKEAAEAVEQLRRDEVEEVVLWALLATVDVKLYGNVTENELREKVPESKIPGMGYSGDKRGRMPSRMKPGQAEFGNIFMSGKNNVNTENPQSNHIYSGSFVERYQSNMMAESKLKTSGKSENSGKSKNPNFRLQVLMQQELRGFKDRLGALVREEHTRMLEEIAQSGKTNAVKSGNFSRSTDSPSVDISLEDLPADVRAWTREQHAAAARATAGRVVGKLGVREQLMAVKLMVVEHLRRRVRDRRQRVREGENSGGKAGRETARKRVVPGKQPGKETTARKNPGDREKGKSHSLSGLLQSLGGLFSGTLAGKGAGTGGTGSAAEATSGLQTNNGTQDGNSTVGERTGRGGGGGGGGLFGLGELLNGLTSPRVGHRGPNGVPVAEAGEGTSAGSTMGRVAGGVVGAGADAGRHGEGRVEGGEGEEGEEVMVVDARGPLSAGQVQLLRQLLVSAAHTQRTATATASKTDTYTGENEAAGALRDDVFISTPTTATAADIHGSTSAANPDNSPAPAPAPVPGATANATASAGASAAAGMGSSAVSARGGARQLGTRAIPVGLVDGFGGALSEQAASLLTNTAGTLPFVNEVPSLAADIGMGSLIAGVTGSGTGAALSGNTVGLSLEDVAADAAAWATDSMLSVDAGGVFNAATDARMERMQARFLSSYLSTLQTQTLSEQRGLSSVAYANNYVNNTAFISLRVRPLGAGPVELVTPCSSYLTEAYTEPTEELSGGHRNVSPFASSGSGGGSDGGSGSGSGSGSGGAYMDSDTLWRARGAARRPARDPRMYRYNPAKFGKRTLGKNKVHDIPDDGELVYRGETGDMVRSKGREVHRPLVTYTGRLRPERVTRHLTPIDLTRAGNSPSSTRKGQGGHDDYDEEDDVEDEAEKDVHHGIQFADVDGDLSAVPLEPREGLQTVVRRRGVSVLTKATQPANKKQNKERRVRDSRRKRAVRKYGNNGQFDRFRSVSKDVKAEKPDDSGILADSGLGMASGHQHATLGHRLAASATQGPWAESGGPGEYREAALAARIQHVLQEQLGSGIANSGENNKKSGRGYRRHATMSSGKRGNKGDNEDSGSISIPKIARPYSTLAQRRVYRHIYDMPATPTTAATHAHAHTRSQRVFSVRRGADAEHVRVDMRDRHLFRAFQALSTATQPCVLRSVPVTANGVDTGESVVECVPVSSSCPTPTALESSSLWAITRVPFSDVPTSSLFLSESMTNLNYDMDYASVNTYPFVIGQMALRNFSPFEQFLTAKAAKRLFNSYTFTWAVEIRPIVAIAFGDIPDIILQPIEGVLNALLAPILAILDMIIPGISTLIPALTLPSFSFDTLGFEVPIGWRGSNTHTEDSEVVVSYSITAPPQTHIIGRAIAHMGRSSVPFSMDVTRSVHVPPGVFGQTTGQLINYDYRVPGIYEGANLVNTEFIVDAL